MAPNSVNVVSHNRSAWDAMVQAGHRWTLPVSSDEIAAARAGTWEICLAERPAPRQWFPDRMAGCQVLCLASGGGEQGPLLAATGAHVTVFDNSEQQLAQDRHVAERDNLRIDCVQGDMRTLAPFEDGRFDIIVHPVSNHFVPEIGSVWAECYRVLQPGGLLLAAFLNPVYFLIGRQASPSALGVRYAIPYSDVEAHSADERQRLFGPDAPLEFGHSLSDQIAGQTRQGFVITDLFEDTREDAALHGYHPIYIATRALKPGQGSL